MARFYPALTSLADGRALVTGGQRDRQTWCFGGRVNGLPPTTGSGDLLHRHSLSNGAVWDDAVTTQVTGQGPRPTPREGHTSAPWNEVGSAFDAVAYFGGSPVDQETWLLRREDPAAFDADYTYRWEQLVTTLPKPAARSEHTAIASANEPSEMIIFGGTQTAGEELWRLFKVGSSWSWQTVTVTPGTADPTARYGHAAVLDGTRMIVYGGSDTQGGVPTDSRVYSFQFTGGGLATGSWSEIPVAGTPHPQPLPRRDHTMVLDSDNPKSLFVYSGHVNRLGTYVSSDTLWRLNLAVTPAEWSQVVLSGPSPGPRANHAAFYDNGKGRLFIFGGEPAPSATPDNFSYFIDPPQTPGSGTALCAQGGEAPLLSGHTAANDPAGSVHARLPEIYTGTWTQQSNSGWLPPLALGDEYPVQFVVPGSSLPGGGGRLLRVGPAPNARYLDIPATGLAGGWQTVPSGDASPLWPQTGVQYEPGKILVAGNRFGPATAKTMDASVIATANWTTRPGWAPRKEHNLVALPNGQVLSTGGLDNSEGSTDGHVRCPQLWTPSTGLWTDPGTGTDLCVGCQLACEPVHRGYHSTAILLPDARVLTGGGFSAPANSVMHVFCPPYLFKSDGTTLAPRPQIQNSPASFTWREPFTVCTNDPASVQKVCLIRPAATTHAVDMNQRYVPLAFERRTDPPRLLVTAPSSPDSAPPGDYLLFVVGSAEGGTSFPEAPSVARWVRIEGPPGTDPCDVVPPTFADFYADVVTPTEMWFVWTAPADDAQVAATGPALSYALRQSLAPITTPAEWNAAAASTGPDPMPAPLPNPTFQGFTVNGLSECTMYHFALRAADDNSNLTPLPSLAFQTLCGGLGGGYSAQRAREEEMGFGASPDAAGSGAPRLAGSSGERGAGATNGVALTSASSPLLPAATLVTETRHLPDGRWRISLRLATAADGLPLSGTEITVESESSDGERETVGHFTPGESENLLGLCTLRERGRVAIPRFLGLERVLARFRRHAQNYALVEAQHSRLGALGADFVAAGGSPELLAGDVIELAYAPANDGSGEAPSWYLLLRRQGTTPPIPFSQRRSLGESAPSDFALHPSEPNPTAGEVVIRFDLPVESAITLEVFDLLGRRVATLADRTYVAGSHRVRWDLRDGSGALVRPGVYAYRLVAGPFRAQGKLGVLP